MSKINWDKPIEFLNGTRWVPARLIVKDIKVRPYDNSTCFGILYETVDPYGGGGSGTVETFYRVDINGKYSGLQKVRNAVKKTKLYGRVYKLGESATKFHSDTLLFNTKSEAEDSALPYGCVFVGTFSTEVIEDVSA